MTTRSIAPAKHIFGLYGAGGFAREVMPIAREYFASGRHGNSRVSLFFLDAHPRQGELNGVPLISEEEFLAIECEARYFNVAIANSALRQRITQEAIGRGATALTLIAGNASLYDANSIGDGAIICGNSMVTSNARIGSFFHSNIYSYVAHDCVIGDFVTFSPRVNCNGNVHIGDHAFVGTGAVLRQGSPEKPLKIGARAVVGMGAVVTRDVPADTTVVGNPARPLERT